MLGEDDDPHLRLTLSEHARQPQSFIRQRRRQSDVGDNDVRLQPLDCLFHPGEVADRIDDVNAVQAANQVLEAFADEQVVLREDDTYRRSAHR